MLNINQYISINININIENILIVTLINQNVKLGNGIGCLAESLILLYRAFVIGLEWSSISIAVRLV